MIEVCAGIGIFFKCRINQQAYIKLYSIYDISQYYYYYYCIDIEGNNFGKECRNSL